MAQQATAHPCFLIIKKQIVHVILLPPEWDASPYQAYTQHKFKSAPISCPWLKRGTVIVKCLAQVNKRNNHTVYGVKGGSPLRNRRDK